MSLHVQIDIRLTRLGGVREGRLDDWYALTCNDVTPYYLPISDQH